MVLTGSVAKLVLQVCVVKRDLLEPGVLMVLVGRQGEEGSKVIGASAVSKEPKGYPGYKVTVAQLVPLVVLGVRVLVVHPVVLDVLVMLVNQEDKFVPKVWTQM